MLTFFYKKLKSQRGDFGLTITVLGVITLIGLGASLYNLGTSAEEKIAKKIPLADYADENNQEDVNKYEEERKKDVVETAIEGGETALGIYDDTGLLTVADKAGLFDIDKNKGNVNNEEEKPKENLDDGIEKMIRRKVELNSNSKTKPQEIETITDEIATNIKKEEAQFDNIDNSIKIIDTDALVKNTLEGIGKLNDKKIIDLKKELKKRTSLYDLDSKIIEKYKYYQSKGMIPKSSTELADADRRLEKVDEEIKEIEAKIKGLELAKEQQEFIETEVVPEEEIIVEEDEIYGVVEEDIIEETTEEVEELEVIPEEEITEEVEETIITLNGTVTQESPFEVQDWTELSITINLETGIVSGTLSWWSAVLDTVDEYTVIGNMNLETKEISAELVHSDGSSTTLTGKLSEDTRSASGDCFIGLFPWNATR
jgi:hypothetical protein